MHTLYLHQALQLAETRKGHCAPNPAVAALVVIDNAVIASGVHVSAGLDHAEVVALANVPEGTDLSEATLYVTLEPCCHWGKTPPCIDAIIQSGIPHVVYGYQDPNPLVSGGGASKLSEMGIRCEHVQLSDIDRFYFSYSHWVRVKRPFVTAKLAMSLDAKIAGQSGLPMAISGKEAKTFTFLHRLHSDAILTSAETVIADDPMLSVRTPFPEAYKPIYLLDRQLRTPLSAKIFAQSPRTTVFYSEYVSGTRVQAYSDQGHRCIMVSDTDEGLDLDEVMKQIGQDGVHDLWVEAGGRLMHSLHKDDTVHRALFYVAPKLIGQGVEAFRQSADWLSKATHLRWSQCGQDAILDVSFVEMAATPAEVE